MKQRSLFVVCVIFAIAGVGAAQTKSVTNADLDKYRQERLKAEQEYRENYARLGLPSPEKLARQRDENSVETEKLAAKLRTERLEKERLNAEHEMQLRDSTPIFQYVPVVSENQYILSAYSTGYGRYRRFLFYRPYYQPYSQPGYYAGGQFWPTPGGVRSPGSGPLWIRRR